MIALKDGLIEPERLGLTFQSTVRDRTAYNAIWPEAFLACFGFRFFLGHLEDKAGSAKAQSEERANKNNACGLPLI